MANPVGRPKEFDEVTVLRQVMSLFWEKGYDATSLTDILQATGLAKGSLYKAFKSKHALYLQALTHYQSKYMGKFIMILNSPMPARTKLNAFLSSPVLDAARGEANFGCFLCNAAADRAPHDPDTRALVDRGFKQLTQALAPVIAEIRPDWSEEQVFSITQSCIMMYSGLRIMSHARVDRDRLEAAKSGLIRFID